MNQVNCENDWWKWGEAAKRKSLSDYPKLKVHIEQRWNKTFNEKTGYHAAKWLKSYLKRKGLKMPEIHCHSQNPIGKNNILKLLNY